jgi:outer membrane lipoprotein-sorting protein
MMHLKIALALLLTAGLTWAQAPSTQPKSPEREQAQSEASRKKDLTPEEIIRRFSAKETEFYEAWMQYTYHQVSEVRVLSKNGMPKNESQTTISDVVFKDDGTREIEIRRRAGNLHSVTYTMNDEEVINNLQPFALTEKALPLYNLSYQGKEKIDELSCYVFSVTPKSIKGKRLFFEGKIWVDDEDLQVVRTVGKPVPQKKGGEQFPEFETIRQMVDKEYWFPVWTHAESQLHFESDTIHIEETITYSDYKRFASKTSIQFEPIQ